MRKWINTDQTSKLLQYLMLVILFGIAFFLPEYGLKRQAEEKAAKQTMQQEVAEEQGAAGQQEIIALQGQTDTQNSVQDQTAQSSETDMTGADTADEDDGKGTIVLDAGHGGFDPGMVGASGINEKVLNLVYAQKLEALLTEAGYRVVMTRTTEDGLYDENESNKKAQDMQRRCAIIEQEQPLVTISIHQNSYSDPSVSGPQVFYFEHSVEGKRLASLIQSSINEQLEITRPRVHKGNDSYYILKRSDSVTVIVECGFLSNPQEEQLLQEEEYQDRMVQAICDGVLQYLEA